VPAATWNEYTATFPQANVILLRREQGRLVRANGSTQLAGRTLTLKPAGPPTAAGFGRGPLWRYFAAP
jgi:hypothetical protein